MFFRLLLYPGVILHELMHLVMCIFLGVKVKGIKFGINESYVKHNDANALKIFLIALAPFMLGNLIAIYLISFSQNNFGQELILFLVFNWLSISFIFYSIPSKPDTKNVKESMYKQMLGLWSKGIFEKLVTIFYFACLFVPAYILLEIIGLFDKFEALRVVLILVLYSLVISLA